MAFEKVAKLIPKQGSFARAAEAALVCAMIEKAIKEIVPELAKEVKVVSFSAGVAKLKISSSSAAAELQVFSKRLIKKTNENLGERFLEKFSYLIC